MQSELDFAMALTALTDAMYRLAYAMLGNRADAEDAVGQAVLTAYEKRWQLRDETMLRSWVMRIVQNTCRSARRVRGRTLPLNEAITAAERDGAQDADLFGALAALPETMRTAVVLFYLEGFSVREIAWMQKAATGTITSRLNRARRLMRERLGEERT